MTLPQHTCIFCKLFVECTYYFNKPIIVPDFWGAQFSWFSWEGLRL